ncbi:MULTISPECIES: head-tail connector protein [Gemella]|uniref:head-tail connector protein n=1 Tax=Gemella TaxID=1378 RepID=UPI000931A3A2|nr:MULTISPECIES: head-tail connector protein [Gemella]AXI27265.1 phage gp6-like head-tail connector protein [Gemella sp. ND 6198]
MTEISVKDVKEYIRVLDDSEDSQLKLLLDSAVEYMISHTGLEETVIRNKSDIKTALLILVSDFYWNRDYQTGNKYNNKLVDNIIENNRINFVK